MQTRSSPLGNSQLNYNGGNAGLGGVVVSLSGGGGGSGVYE